MSEAITQQEKRYLVPARAEKLVEELGSVRSAIKYLQEELNEYQSMWSDYSSECLGHGITCNRLLIEYLKRTTP